MMMKAEAEHYEDQARQAAKDLAEGNARIICNQCAHRWLVEVAGHPVKAVSVIGTCPECGSDDIISEADLLTVLAESRLPG